MQKVIKENGTKQLLELNIKNKFFTESKKNNSDPLDHSNIIHHSLNETKRKKLMNVLDDLVQLKNKLDTEK